MGIDNFFNALTLIFEKNPLMNDIECLNIFLAGNFSNNQLFQQLFRERLNKEEKMINANDKKGENNIFNLYLPLGSGNKKINWSFY